MTARFKSKAAPSAKKLRGALCKSAVPYRFAGDLDLDYLEARLRAGDLASAIAHGDEVLLRRGYGSRAAR